MRNTGRILWLALSVTLVGSIIRIAILHGEDMRERPPDSLEVSVAAPRGEILVLHSIDVVFGASMIPLGSRGEGTGSIPLEMTPSLPGAFTWIGTRALSFVPRGEVAPGSVITCRVPKGTRSLDGAETTVDYTWQIVVARPRLLASVPDRGQAVAAGEPIHLLFSIPPEAAAADSVRLVGPSGAIPLARVTPDTNAAKVLIPRGERRLGQANILALRPVGTMTAGENYSLEVAAGTRFLGSSVGLAAPVKVPFRTFGEPRFETASADDFGLSFTLAGPVDPESLHTYLAIRPSIGSYRIQPNSGTSFALEQAHIRGGTTYTLTLRAGLPSLLGGRLAGSQTVQVTTPHRDPKLRIAPGDGYVPMEKGVAIRIDGLNVDSVRVTGGWIRPENVAGLFTGGYGDADIPRDLPPIATWLEARATPESLRTVLIPIERFGARPAGTRALAIRVAARSLFRMPDGGRILLRDNALIQITDLGLATFAGSGGGVAWATRLSTGAPIEGATISIEAPARPGKTTPGRAATTRPLWSGRTDAEGLVRIPPLAEIGIPPGAGPIASIRMADDAAWLRMPVERTAGDGGRDEETTTIFTFNDRPLYRPGETVRWVSHARHVTRRGIAASTRSSVVYRITDSEGQQHAVGTIPLASPGDGSGSFTIPQEAPLGNYSIVYRSSLDERAPSLGSKMFQIEEYRLPRFQARVSAPREPVISGTTVAVEGRFSYLNGGSLAGMPVVWTVTRNADWSRPAGFYDYAFEDPRAQGTDAGYGYAMHRVASGEGTLDSDGSIRVPLTPDLTGLGQDQRYWIEIGARDLTDRSAYATADFAVHRAAIRVGARARLSEEEGGRTPRTISLSAVCVDSAESVLAGVPLRWRIEKRMWKTVRVRRIGGIFGYENVPVDSLSASGEGGSANPPSAFAWTPPTAGLYSFVVEGRDARGRVARARHDIYVPGPEVAAWYRDDHDWLELRAGRRIYNPGDTARVLIPAPAIPTEGLVILADDGIREVRRLPRVTGSPEISIPLDGIFPPGLWLQTVLIGPPSVPQGMPVLRRLPYHGWGSIHLDVRPDDWKIDVDVRTDRPAYRPGDEVLVRITQRDSRGRPISGMATLAVVDDAIFELIDTGAPDPIDTFFAFRGQGYIYADVRNDLKLAPRGEKGALTPGGDGDEGAGRGLRRRFLPTVHWEPLVPVGADGNATVRFRLGDDLTRLRFRVLASSGTDRFGYSETKAPVTKPLQIEWGTPRFVREGDRVDAVAVVRGDFPKSTGVRVSAEARGARIEGKRNVKVKVGAGRNGRAVFRLTGIGTEGITFTVRAEGGGARDGISTTIPFDRPILFEREFAAGRAEPDFKTPIVTTGTAIPDLGGLHAVVSPSMLSGLDDALSSVIDYPYGCLEQLSSVLLALATQRALEAHLGVPAGPDSTDRARRLERAVAQMQSTVEPWTLHSWPSTDSETASDYTAGYALYAITRAREAGLAVPRSLFDAVSDDVARRQQRVFEESAARPTRTSRLLFEGPWLIRAQSEADRLRPPDSARVRIADIEALWSRMPGAPLESRISLAIASANLRARPEAASVRQKWLSLSSSLLEGIRSRDLMRTARYVWLHQNDLAWGDGIGDAARASALYLHLLAAADPRDADLPMILAWLLNERRPESGAWMNEHVSALALDAVVATAARIEGPLAGVTGTLSIGTRAVPFEFAAAGATPRGAGLTPLRVSIPWADLAGKGTFDLRLTTDGRAPAYLAATLDRARPALDSPAREEGLIVARDYVDASGRDLGNRLPLADPLYVHLAVVVSRDAKSLVVEDPLPGGVEAVNLRFSNAPGISMSGGARPGMEGGSDSEPGRGEEGGASSLWIVHREMGDRSVRLFAEGVAAGIYHIYYPAIATNAGTYNVPGARAEMLYSPEVYGISEPRTITIERMER